MRFAPGRLRRGSAEGIGCCGGLGGGSERTVCGPLPGTRPRSATVTARPRCVSVSAAALALRHGIAGCGSGGERVGAASAAAGIVEERRMEYIRVVGEAAETSTWVPAGLLRLSESQAAAILRPRPPRRPRNGSRSAAVRAWVLSLDPCTVFWIHDMPLELRAFAPRVLHDMVQEDIPVERICNGFYRRGTQAPDVPVRDRRAKTGHLGIAYAGAGSGYAHIAAVNEVGWTTQVPARAVVAPGGQDPLRRLRVLREYAAPRLDVGRGDVD